MVVYEVVATVEEQARDAYVRYMRERHIADVLATGCFLGATFAQESPTRFRAAYRVPDQSTLDRYLRDHAPALRASFGAHGVQGVTFAREVWQVVQEFTP